MADVPPPHAPLAAIRAALPPLWHNDFDELEDVTRLVMDVNVAVANEHRDDIVTYVLGIWALAEAERDRGPVDGPARDTIIEQTGKALKSLQSSGGNDGLHAVQKEVKASGVWELPNPEAVAVLLETSA